MRDHTARLILFAFGILAIIAGARALLGWSRLDLSSAIWVGIGAIGSGIGMVRVSRGPNPRIGALRAWRGAVPDERHQV